MQIPISQDEKKQLQSAKDYESYIKTVK